MSEVDTPVRRGPGAWITLALIGVVAGFLSGFFGVGGGTVIVPALVFFAGFGQRLATGTSLAAIVFPAIAGLIGYAQTGHVDWIAGLLIAAGAIVGAQIGSWLLHKLPVTVLRWIFVGFLFVVGIQLLFTVPDRTAVFELTPVLGVLLVVLGFVTGILAGLIGVGGGIIVVPVLTVFFGVSDLVAKGTSLFMILPTSASGTVSNLKRKNADLPAALVIGGVAAAASIGGVAVAQVSDPQVASILFGIFVVLLIVRMVVHAIRGRGKA